ncbi:SigE family RNA polymerase sigma factor [Nocardioides conyzicola]|uniref:SigE family RNA polymerase sigma factor n=2 Tax=Nocardioides conyzicola TaxID=1651781 RepID=A0ABP8WVR3_9ACTN
MVGAGSVAEGAPHDASSSSESFDDWVRARQDALLRFATLITADSDLARDLVQDALTRMYARWSRVSRLEGPDAYARRIIVNQNVSRWRRDRRVTVVDPAEMVSTPVPGHESTISDRVTILAALARLPRDQRVAVVLRYYEDLSYQEIATLTGVREGTVRSRVSRGISSLEGDFR